LLPGDLISSISILEETPHFSARALTSVQTSGFPRSDIRDKFFTDPDTLPNSSPCWANARPNSASPTCSCI
jgi:CRP-like cAMP-binding protein